MHGKIQAIERGLADSAKARALGRPHPSRSRPIRFDNDKLSGLTHGHAKATPAPVNPISYAYHQTRTLPNEPPIPYRDAPVLVGLHATPAVENHAKPGASSRSTPSAA